MGVKTFIGTTSGARQLSKIWVGNSGGKPAQIKKAWVGTSSGPKLIFGDLFSEAVFWADAYKEIGFTGNSEAPFYTNQITGEHQQIQVPWKGLGGGNSSWDYGQVNDYWANGNSHQPGARPWSYNCQYRYRDSGPRPSPDRGLPGRGGTIRLPKDTWDATLMMVMWVDPEKPITAGPNFYNTCFFNAASTYEQGDDYSLYTGATVAYMYWGGSVAGAVNMWSPGSSGNINEFWGNFRRVVICTMATSGNDIMYRLRTRPEPTIYGDSQWPGVGVREVYQARKSNAMIRDVRINDWTGGGVMAMKGELYEALVFDRSLSYDEIYELEDYYLGEKYYQLY